MPELTHDSPDDGFHEIQLSGKQLVFLVMTASIVLVFTFLSGVRLGRGVREAKGEAPAATVAQAQAPTVDSSADSRPADPPVPAEDGATPVKPDTFTYPDRLEGSKPAEGTLKKPEEPPAQAVAARAEAPPAPQPRPALDVPTSGRPGALVVQVFASQDAAAASTLVKRLAAKGYPAFLATPGSASAPQTYRVQVGRYNDRREAEQVKRRLEKEEQFKPWITSR